MTFCTQTENECGAVFVWGVLHHPSGSSSVNWCFRIVLPSFEKSPAHRPSNGVAITTLVTASSRARTSWSFAMKSRPNCKGAKILHLIAQCFGVAAVVSEHIIMWILDRRPVIWIRVRSIGLMTKILLAWFDWDCYVLCLRSNRVPHPDCVSSDVFAQSCAFDILDRGHNDLQYFCRIAWCRQVRWFLSLLRVAMLLWSWSAPSALKKSQENCRGSSWTWAGRLTLHMKISSCFLMKYWLSPSTAVTAIRMFCCIYWRWLPSVLLSHLVWSLLR